MPISVTTISVSWLRSASSVSGRPISCCGRSPRQTVRATGLQERREDILRGHLAARAGDRDDAPRRCGREPPGRAPPSQRTSPSGTSVAAAPRAPAWSRRATPPPSATNRSAGSDAARVDLDAGHDLGIAFEPAEAERPQLCNVERDQARAPNVRSACPRRLPVVEQDGPVGELLALFGALAGDQPRRRRRARAGLRVRSPPSDPAPPRRLRPCRRRSRR